MKEYVVWFYVKENGTEYQCDVVVEAENAKNAKARCKEWFHSKTGKNAFRPTTKEPEPQYQKWYIEHGKIRHYYPDGTYRREVNV